MPTKFKLDLPDDVRAIPNLPAHLTWRAGDRALDEDPRKIVEVGVVYQTDGPDGPHETETWPVKGKGDLEAAQAIIEKEIAPLLRELFAPKASGSAV